MANAVSASDTWENNTELADLYMGRMSNAYGQYVWGESMEEIASQWDVADDSIDNEEVFENNLEDVGAIVHSRSSNTYGAMDTDDFFQYFGGLNLVVSEASDMKPETYVMNLQNPDAEKIETLSTYLSREIVTRYLNPGWIEGMQQHGFEGAGMMGDFIENLWGWEALNPDLIDDYVWDDVYNTYFTGDNSEWIKGTNSYEYQSMTARMLETARKGGWDASDEQLKSLVSEYVETIAETGDVTCCHHTCGNPALQEYVDGYLSMPGIVDEATAEQYREIMDEATQPETQHLHHLILQQRRCWQCFYTKRIYLKLLGDLYCIKGGSFENLVTADKEFQAVVSEHDVLPYPANFHIVFLGGCQGHWVHIVLDIVLQLNTFDRCQQFFGIIRGNWFFSFDNNAFPVNPECRDSHTGATDRDIGFLKYLVGLPDNFHFLAGVIILLETVDMRNCVENDRMDKGLMVYFFIFKIVLCLIDQFIHPGGSCSTGCLVGADYNFIQAVFPVKGVKGNSRNRGCTVGVCNQF